MKIKHSVYDYKLNFRKFFAMLFMMTILRDRQAAASVSEKRVMVVTPAYLPSTLKERRESTGWLKYHNSQTDALGLNGIPSGVHSFFKRLKLNAPLALKAALAGDETDAFLTHNEETGLVLAALKRLGLVEAELNIYNHAPNSDGPLGIKRWLTRFGRYDRMICLSQQEADTFIEKYNVDPKKVAVNPTPISTGFFEPQPGVETDHRDPFIFTSGVSDRDYPSLVTALGSIPDVSCVIDPYSPSDPLNDASWKKGAPGNIKFESFRTPEAIRNAINRSRFVVLAIDKITPQISAGCTLATLASAMEKPIIAASNGLREYIQDGQTGILVPPGEPQLLAEAIKELWNNTARAEEMGRNGRHFMKERFSTEGWSKRFDSILNS